MTPFSFGVAAETDGDVAEVVEELLAGGLIRAVAWAAKQLDIATAANLPSAVKLTPTRTLRIAL